MGRLITRHQAVLIWILVWLQGLTLEIDSLQFLRRNPRTTRAKSVRHADLAEARAGYRNGYGKPRRVALTSGTIEVCRPRLRSLTERFESRVLPLSALRAWVSHHANVEQPHC